MAARIIQYNFNFGKCFFIIIKGAKTATEWPLGNENPVSSINNDSGRSLAVKVFNREVRRYPIIRVIHSTGRYFLFFLLNIKISVVNITTAREEPKTVTTDINAVTKSLLISLKKLSAALSRRKEAAARTMPIVYIVIFFITILLLFYIKT